MKLILALLATSALALWVGLAPAQAKSDDFILSFEPPALPEPAPTPAPPAPPSPAPEHQPLPIPAHASRPPMRFHSPSQLPSGVYRQAVAMAIQEGQLPADVLPPAPPILAPGPSLATAPEPVVPVGPEVATPPAADPSPMDSVVLNFDLDSTLVPPAPIAQTLPPEAPPPPLVDALFEGGSQSLVARTVGSAEGTRTATGEMTPAYRGHTDPGNHAWNLGTFSYQHGATSAEEADRKQIARLRSQTDVLKRRALRRSMGLTLEETLNGIDLANQSPLAAIGRVGYIERLAEVKTWGLEGTEAIVVARTRSYINPNTGRWNAPGLGNTEASITRDQRRRTDAIARALAAYRLEHPDQDLSPTLITIAPPAPTVAAAPAPPPVEPTPDPLPLQFDLDTESRPMPTVATFPEAPIPLALAAIPGPEPAEAIVPATTESIETPESTESTESTESIETPENPESTETTENPESPENPESTKSTESTESTEIAENPESTETPESTESTEPDPIASPPEAQPGQP
ncbi:MAG: hypothetical protein VKI82_10735 [Leptolyngbya sp.]|nr:hypothetical protein [Leptolyngbya sp.]